MSLVSVVYRWRVRDIDGELGVSMGNEVCR